MKLLLTGGRVVDPALGHDAIGDIAIDAGRIVGVGAGPAGFAADRTIDASGLIVAPGLVDLAVRLREPGYEHEGMLESEMAAAVAGGVTRLVCPPDTDPVLDEPGLVEMLAMRADKLRQARVHPLGALTRGLEGKALTEMAELAEAGCIGFGQAEVPILDTQVLQRAMQYAATYGFTVWLRPQDAHLGRGVAASGAVATRLGLAGVPVAAETIALFTIFELVRSTGARVHLCRLSSAAGVELLRRAKADGLPVTADVSIHSLHLTDIDIGHFDSRFRLAPPLRQQRDRDALRAALADGTIDALVSDHVPVEADAKTLPFAEAEAGASAVELLLGAALKWGEEARIDLARVLAAVTTRPGAILRHGVVSDSAKDDEIGSLAVGSAADFVVFDPKSHWRIDAATLRSRGKHTPFSGYEWPGRVRWTLVRGEVAYDAEAGHAAARAALSADASRVVPEPSPR